MNSMGDSEATSLEQIRTFLAGSDAVQFAGEFRGQTTKPPNAAPMPQLSLGM